MNNEDIEFEILNELGNPVNCVVMASVPVDENTINVMYKREDDKDDVFRYGKIIKEADTYIINKDISDEDYIDLRLAFDEEIINIAKNYLTELEAE
ncbi:MAG: hypothetical protein IJ463_04225 [Bacilli bacterium]|nr:hypothetical protein [Bacilli bacterium]